MKSLFTAVTEGRVPQVVGKAGTGQKVPGWQPLVLHGIFFVPVLQHSQQSFTNLRRLDRMCEAGSMKVTFPNPHYLRLCLEPSKRRRVYDACPVSLVFVAIIFRPRLFIVPDSSPKLPVNHCLASRQSALDNEVIREIPTIRCPRSKRAFGAVSLNSTPLYNS